MYITYRSIPGDGRFSNPARNYWSASLVREGRITCLPRTTNREAGAGKLVITGRSGIDHVRVDATLCASDRERMDALNVSLDGGRLDTDYPRNGASGWFGRPLCAHRSGRAGARRHEPACGRQLGQHRDHGCRRVGGTVRIDGGGSGSVTVRDVEGDLVVTDTRRSRIRFSDIRGVLDLPPEKRKGRGR